MKISHFLQNFAYNQRRQAVYHRRSCYSEFKGLNDIIDNETHNQNSLTEHCLVKSEETETILSRESDNFNRWRS